MRGAIGNSSLLFIIIFFLSAIVLIFTGILSYSKAYKVKNRIIEVIEERGTYDTEAENKIIASLTEMGYRMGSCPKRNVETNNTGFMYCVERKNANEDGSEYYYKVTTYIQFYFPIIQEVYNPPVTSETKILGRNYNY